MRNRKIKIKRIDTSIPLPVYKTRGAVAFDLAARQTTHVPAGSVGYIPLNVVVEVPKDHVLLLAARSSSHKLGLMPVHGIGLVDTDYCGEDDELRAPVYNFTKKTVTIPRGTRIAQGLLVKFTRGSWKEVSQMNAKTRGGFGSTGHK